MRLRNIRISVALLLIISIAAFLRLFTLNKLMVFAPDEEYILYITQTLVKHLHIIWIGVSALGFDFYLGPGFEYFLTPFIWLFKGDPIIWGIITSISGVATTYLIYWFGKKVFNRKTALIASLIYGTSALLVYYDQGPYPSGVPLLSVLLLISIYMTKYSKKWWIVFSFLYGIIFHIHLSLVLTIIVAVYWASTHRKSWNFNTILLSLVAFIFVMSPLIGFDYFHKLSNITAPIRVIQAMGKSKIKFDIGNRIGKIIKSTSRIFYLDVGKSNTDEILYPCNSVPGSNSTNLKWPIILIVVALLISYFRRKDIWKDEGKKLLLLFSLVFVIPFVFLSSIGPVEYYLLGFFPFFILMIANGIAILPKNFKLISCVIIFVFVIYNIYTVIGASGDYGLAIKKKMVNDVMRVVGSSSYSLLETGGPCQGTAGWGYLFSIFGRPPDNNIADRQFSWLLPIGNMSKTKYIVIINESRFPINIKKYQYKFTEGGFTAFLTKK